jgi:NADPH:quinone reductase-like Zn-dependent oxidoreductase
MSTHTAIATTSIGVLDTIEVPTPSPASSEVLIKIQYASLVPLDFRMLDVGFYVQSYPARLGFNAAGTIVTVGSDITNLSVGDRVNFFSMFHLQPTAEMKLGYCVQPYQPRWKEFATIRHFSRRILQQSGFKEPDHMRETLTQVEGT